MVGVFFSTIWGIWMLNAHDCLLIGVLMSSRWDFVGLYYTEVLCDWKIYRWQECVQNGPSNSGWRMQSMVFRRFPSWSSLAYPRLKRQVYSYPSQQKTRPFLRTRSPHNVSIIKLINLFFLQFICLFHSLPGRAFIGPLYLLTCVDSMVSQRTCIPFFVDITGKPSRLVLLLWSMWL